MQNRVIGVVAPKGSGKTTVVAEQLVRPTPRVAIYDPMGETDFQYHYMASEIVKADLHKFHELIAEENFQVLYIPEAPQQDGEEWFYPDFRPFLQKIWRRVQLIGPMMVIVDEAHYTMSKRTMPLEMWNIITNGRRYGLDVVWITQRFVGVNGWVRANADEYWFFRLVHPADLQTVNEVCGPEVMEQVRNLRRLDANAVPVIPGQLLKWNSLDGSVVIEDLNDGKETRPPEDENDTSGSGSESGEDEGERSSEREGHPS
jgi:hypothetical protein